MFLIINKCLLLYYYHLHNNITYMHNINNNTNTFLQLIFPELYVNLPFLMQIIEHYIKCITINIMISMTLPLPAWEQQTNKSSQAKAIPPIRRLTSQNTNLVFIIFGKGFVHMCQSRISWPMYRDSRRSCMSRKISPNFNQFKNGGSKHIITQSWGCIFKELSIKFHPMFHR